MCKLLHSPWKSRSRTAGIGCFLAALSVLGSRLASAQPSPSDPPVTYEVQIDGESFRVEGSQRPIKVESKLKKGTTYTLAIRVAPIQVLRLNSAQLEYGMWAKVVDNKGKDLRTVRIEHELGFILILNDMGRFLDAKHQDELLKTIADDAEKRFTDHGAHGLTRTAPFVKKFGPSDSKFLSIHYTDSEGLARSCMIFVLSGKSYTVSAVVEYRDQDKDDVLSWVKNALESMRPLE